jgi:hypothetical protein
MVHHGEEVDEGAGVQEGAIRQQRISELAQLQRALFLEKLAMARREHAVVRECRTKRQRERTHIECVLSLSIYIYEKLAMARREQAVVRECRTKRQSYRERERERERESERERERERESARARARALTSPCQRAPHRLPLLLSIINRRTLNVRSFSS